jgi:hypothetical protein
MVAPGYDGTHANLLVRSDEGACDRNGFLAMPAAAECERRYHTNPRPITNTAALNMIRFRGAAVRRGIIHYDTRFGNRDSLPVRIPSAAPPDPPCGNRLTLPGFPRARLLRLNDLVSAVTEADVAHRAVRTDGPDWIPVETNTEPGGIAYA